jgi:hypothetical protein
MEMVVVVVVVVVGVPPLLVGDAVVELVGVLASSVVLVVEEATAKVGGTHSDVAFTSGSATAVQLSSLDSAALLKSTNSVMVMSS